jgi:hypothetical protein
MRASLRGPAIPAVAIDHRWQAKIFPQGATFILSAKQPAAPQFGNHHVNEILAAAGQCGRGDVETIAGPRFEPRLHRISDVGGRSDGRGTGKTGTQVYPDSAGTRNSLLRISSAAILVIA